jgi:hypothetical protein
MSQRAIVVTRASIPASTTVARLRSLAVPLALYLVGLLAMLPAAWSIGFALSEGSAYYVAVAGNLATGRGPVLDAIWSYATPPLVLPRPAFELWQPLASLLMAPLMAVLGSSLGTAQTAMALVAALVALLSWLVARDALRALDVPDRRRAVLAAGTALVTVVAGPLLIAVALPDSTVPFTVAALAACWLTARSLAPEAGRDRRVRLWLALGAVLGLAWLARHEAIWLAVVAVALAAATRRLTARQLSAALVGGLLVTGPWLLRNLLVFGRPLPGQAVDNVLLVSNEQIFAYQAPPSLDAFLAQGPAVIVGNIAEAARHNVVDVLFLPAAPLALFGVIGLAWLLVRHRAVWTSALGVLAIGGGLTLLATTLLFPVASLWGTFQHAAGPVVVALAVAGVIGLDRTLVEIGRRRGWRNDNAWLAPLLLALLVVPLSALQLSGLAGQAAARADQMEGTAAAVLAQPEAAAGRPTLITDRPIWLSEATGLPAIALPAESLASLEALAADFDAALVVVGDGRGEYPGLLRTDAARRCFVERAPIAGQPPLTAIFEVRPSCR